MQKSEVISLYGQLIDRNKHEGTLFWGRYSAFFSIVSLFLVVWRYSLSKSPESFLGDSFISLFFMCSGIAASFCWFLVAFDGAKWQEYFNEQIIKLEKSHDFLPQVYSSMYQSKLIPDVVSVAISVSFFTFIGWLAAVVYTNKINGIIGLLTCLMMIMGSRIVQKLLEKSSKSKIEEADNKPLVSLESSYNNTP